MINLFFALQTFYGFFYSGAVGSKYVLFQGLGKRFIYPLFVRPIDKIFSGSPIGSAISSQHMEKIAFRVAKLEKLSALLSPDVDFDVEAITKAVKEKKLPKGFKEKQVQKWLKAYKYSEFIHKSFFNMYSYNKNDDILESQNYLFSIKHKKLFLSRYDLEFVSKHVAWKSSERLTSEDLFALVKHEAELEKKYTVHRTSLDRLYTTLANGLGHIRAFIAIRSVNRAINIAICAVLIALAAPTGGLSLAWPIIGLLGVVIPTIFEIVFVAINNHKYENKVHESKVFNLIQQELDGIIPNLKKLKIESKKSKEEIREEIRGKINSTQSYTKRVFLKTALFVSMFLPEDLSDLVTRFLSSSLKLTLYNTPFSQTSSFISLGTVVNTVMDGFTKFCNFIALGLTFFFYLGFTINMKNEFHENENKAKHITQMRDYDCQNLTNQLPLINKILEANGQKSIKELNSDNMYSVLAELKKYKGKQGSQDERITADQLKDINAEIKEIEKERPQALKSTKKAIVGVLVCEGFWEPIANFFGSLFSTVTKKSYNYVKLNDRLYPEDCKAKEECEGRVVEFKKASIQKSNTIVKVDSIKKVVSNKEVALP